MSFGLVNMGSQLRVTGETMVCILRHIQHRYLVGVTIVVETGSQVLEGVGGRGAEYGAGYGGA